MTARFSSSPPTPANSPASCPIGSRWQPLQLPVHWARTGRWKGREVIAIANGAGADRAFAAVLVAPKSSAICNIGFCGALDEALRIGDVVVATEVRNGTQTLARALPDAPRSPRPAPSPPSTTSPRPPRKNSNLRPTGASIVEMEAAGVARAAEDLDLPFYCIRAVSDLAAEDFANDFNAALRPDGRFSITASRDGSPGQPASEIRRTDASETTHRPRVKKSGRLSCRRFNILILVHVPHNMRAAVYRGNSVVSVDDVDDARNRPRRNSHPRGSLRRLPHRSQEDRIQPARAAAHLRP